MRKLFYALVLVVDGLMILVFWKSWCVTIPVFIGFYVLFKNATIEL